MATQSNRSPREVVDFPLNIPVTVALKYGQGKTVSTQYGERIMFTLADNRIMFLDPDVAGQIVQAGINVRESFTITRKQDGPQAPWSWEIARPAGEQSDGTFVVPKLAETAAAPKPPQRATSSTPLVDEANALVDAFAKVLERTLSKYEGRVKPDEVRSRLLSAYIQRGKLSSVA